MAEAPAPGLLQPPLPSAAWDGPLDPCPPSRPGSGSQELGIPAHVAQGCQGSDQPPCQPAQAHPAAGAHTPSSRGAVWVLEREGSGFNTRAFRIPAMKVSGDRRPNMRNECPDHL